MILSKIQTTFTKVREVFWPLLERYVESPKTQISTGDIKIEKESDLKIAYELAQKFYDDERERNKTIETKSIVFISSIGFVITFIIGITNLLLSSKNIRLDLIVVILAMIAFLIIIYFVRAAWYSIKALKRREFKVLNISDITQYDKDYLKEIAAKIINISKENSKVINLRVDFMTMAQEYYQRAIITLVVYSFLIFFILIKNLRLGSDNAISYWHRLKFEFNIDNWILIFDLVPK